MGDVIASQLMIAASSIEQMLKLKLPNAKMLADRERAAITACAQALPEVASSETDLQIKVGGTPSPNTARSGSTVQ